LSVRPYLINLDRSADRLAFMTSQAAAIGFEFTRLAAVDGCALEDGAGPLSKPATGCFLSHMLAWRAIAAGCEPWGVVLEDDAKISPAFPEIVAGLAFPADADIVKLEAWPEATAFHRPGIPIAGRALFRQKGNLMGTAAYAITRDACRSLLAIAPACPTMPVDRWLFTRKSPIAARVTTYVMHPAPVIQQAYVAGEGDILTSIIHVDRADQRRQAKPKTAFRRIRRSLRRSIDEMFRPVVYRPIEWR
jgi:glycosyl transferase family 25